MTDSKDYVVRQPAGGNPFFVPTVEWSVGLYDCFSDVNECLCAYFCSCCFMHSLGKSINEESLCGFCIPNRLAVYRMKVRSILHIEGSAMKDCCIVGWCGFCAALQLKLELKSRGLA